MPERIPSIVIVGGGFGGLADAVAIRNRILEAFERAEAEEDPSRHRDLLTFVLVGGGAMRGSSFTGASPANPHLVHFVTSTKAAWPWSGRQRQMRPTKRWLRSSDNQSKKKPTTLSSPPDASIFAFREGAEANEGQLRSRAPRSNRVEVPSQFTPHTDGLRGLF
jgi:hypothetical protein